MVLHHPARRAAGAAGVDDAGEVAAPDIRNRRPQFFDVGIAGDHRRPVMRFEFVARLAGADVVDLDQMMAVGRGR